MSIKESGHHFIAIFGGAVAGAEAAYQLSKRGFRIVVFDQAILPFGKIEDGLPKWHYKLRDKEDFQIRLAQFFDHYLKGEPMPKWMKEGISAVNKGVDLGY